jgi:hypothetical protein
MNESIRRPHTSAEVKARAVTETEGLIKSGMTVRDAVYEVAYRTGISERTLFTCLQKTKGLTIGDRTSALERKPVVSRPRRPCHPQALNRFVELCRNGRYISECYRQLMSEAEERGWSPIPSERQMRRLQEKQMSSSDRWMARRGAGLEGRN